LGKSIDNGCSRSGRSSVGCFETNFAHIRIEHQAIRVLIAHRIHPRVTSDAQWRTIYML
jgi:hypothetical protein